MNRREEMTIDETINILTELQRDLTSEDECPAGDAIKLGIEALKNLRNQRATGIAALEYKLPGETTG